MENILWGECWIHLLLDIEDFTMNTYRKLKSALTFFVGAAIVVFSAFAFGQTTCQYANWQSQNLSRATGGPTIWGTMIAEKALQSGVGRRYDLVGRTGNNLSHYWRTSTTGWRGEDLTSIANQGRGGHLIRGNPAFKASSDGVLRHDVFASGTHRDLIQYFWTARTNWQSYNLTQSTGKEHKILGDPIFLPGKQRSRDGTTYRHDVFATNSSRELIHYWWTSNAGWDSENLTWPSRRPSIVSRLTGVSFSRGDRIGYQTHIFGRDGNNHLIHYWWHARAGWDAEDLTARTGGPSITSDPEVNHSWSSGSPIEVLATNTNGHIIRYWSYSTNMWDHDNLTTSLGGESIIGKPTVLTTLQLNGNGAFEREDIWGRSRDSLDDLVHYWSWDVYGSGGRHTQTWQQPENLTANFSVSQIMGDPVATDNRDPHSLRQEVLGRYSGHLMSSCWTAASGWESDSLTNRAARSPNDTDYIDSDPIVTEDGKHVFARNRWGEVIHYWH